MLRKSIWLWNWNIFWIYFLVLMWKTSSFKNSPLVQQLILYTLSCFHPSLFSTTLVHWMYTILINTHLFIGLIPCRRCAHFMTVAMVIAPRPNYQHKKTSNPLFPWNQWNHYNKKCPFHYLNLTTVMYNQFSFLTWLTMFVLIINRKNSNVHYD